MLIAVILPIKSRQDPPDLRNMVTLPLFAWVVIALAAATAMLGFLSALANEVLHETSIHQLRSQVINLRCKYLRRLIDVYNLEDPDDSFDVKIFTEEDLNNEQPDSLTPEAEPQQAAAA